MQQPAEIGAELQQHQGRHAHGPGQVRQRGVHRHHQVHLSKQRGGVGEIADVVRMHRESGQPGGIRLARRFLHRVHVVQKPVREADAPGLAAFAVHADDIGDFADTAALLAQMDLVVTVDTALAHLAGAMGMPVWVLVQFGADFRWLRQRTDSPWYPTARLFRQHRYGNWSGALEAVNAALREYGLR